MRNGFFKGHGLGNDYIAVDPAQLEFGLTPPNIRLICDRHRGLGSDGILALEPSSRADFGLRIFNPDGSEAEKSGNGLRIFSRYLHATGRTSAEGFTVETKGGIVSVRVVLDAQGDVVSATVEMGQARFAPSELPCTLEAAELVDQPIQVGDRQLRFTGVSLGNPHCVLLRNPGETWTRDELLALGPALENHPIFPRRINVQLAVPTGAHELFILIWERGAGETQASGSSACAAASAAVRAGLVRSPVTVRAPGGALQIEVDPAFNVRMSGPVSEVAQGTFSRGFLRELGA